ncbi:hypothetical protein [Shewanella colwelliana]|uniref:hypothetical protein n=1 Tax=Shewanella colwelliana TaxID=23 RepID=UPI0022AEB443|nr:hypothetical protein [Shewanella colwelliana]MCZ4337732.1 hypothetical protein [Shewanella colwelliana]
MRTLPLAAALCLLTGCTSTLTTIVIDDNSHPSARAAKQGLVYHLPASRQIVTLTHTLVYCMVDNGSISYDYHTKATIRQTGHPDPSKVFVVNPADLHKFTKDWGLTVKTYPNGLLKSFSTNADDKSIELGIAAVKTVANVAAISQGIPVSLSGIQFGDTTKKEDHGVATPKVMCIPELKDEARVTVVFDGLKATVSNKQAALKRAQKILSAAKGDTTAQEQAVLAAQKAVSKANLALANFQKKITLQREFTFETAQIVSDGVTPVPQDIKVFLPWVMADKTDLRYEIAEDMATKYQFDLIFATPFVTGLPKESSMQPTEEYPGLYYSTFGTRQIEITRNARNDLTPQTLLFSGFISAPEFGHVGILPFKNQLGESNSFTALFDINGALTDVTYATERPGSENVTSALYETTDFYNDYTQNRQTVRDADKAKSQTLKIHALTIANSTYPDLAVYQLTARTSIIQSLLLKLGDTEQSREAISSLAMNVDNDNLVRLAEAL